MLKLYQLCGENRDAGFSPYAWRVKLCLMHKGLAFEEEAIRFLEKEKIAHVQPQTIPVLDDKQTSIVDSLAIADYLETAYPEPSLFGGHVAQVQAPILNRWLDMTLIMGMFPMLALDIFNCLDAPAQAYFRETREARLGMTLEKAATVRSDRLAGWQKSLAPLREGLKRAPFLSGATPAWLDYAVFGSFMWARTVSDFNLLADDDPLYAWREAMLDLFKGVPRAAPFAYS